MKYNHNTYSSVRSVYKTLVKSLVSNFVRKNTVLRKIDQIKTGKYWHDLGCYLCPFERADLYCRDEIIAISTTYRNQHRKTISVDETS